VRVFGGLQRVKAGVDRLGQSAAPARIGMKNRDLAGGDRLTHSVSRMPVLPTTPQQREAAEDPESRQRSRLRRGKGLDFIDTIPDTVGATQVE
jgi:hypothetical protein